MQQLESDKIKVQAALSSAAKNLTQEEAYAAKAFTSLAQTYCQQINLAATFTLATCTAFPSSSELSNLGVLADTERYETAYGRWESWQAMQNTWNTKQASLTEPQARLAEFAVQYPPDKLNFIKAEDINLTKDETVLASQNASLTERLKQLEQEFNAAKGQLEKTQRYHHQLQLEFEKTAGQKKVLEDNLHQALARLDKGWQTAASTLNTAVLEKLYNEQRNLAQAPDQLRQLGVTRLDEVSYREQLTFDMDGVDEEARRPLAQLEAEEKLLLAQQQTVRENVGGLRRQHAKVTEILDQRAKLNVAHKNAAQEAELYKRLSGYLDYKQIQQYLLKEAEQGIVAEANAVLDRISSGTLRLDFSEESKSDTAKSEILDLVLYNAATQSKRLPTELLSGSQQFRIAVSLALGIGRFASSRTQPVSSVIIDEGFGSLDKVALR